jgi:hypothetical protein
MFRFDDGMKEKITLAAKSEKNKTRRQEPGKRLFRCIDVRSMYTSNLISESQEKSSMIAIMSNYITIPPRKHRAGFSFLH